MILEWWILMRNYLVASTLCLQLSHLYLLLPTDYDSSFTLKIVFLKEHIHTLYDTITILNIQTDIIEWFFNGWNVFALWTTDLTFHYSTEYLTNLWIVFICISIWITNYTIQMVNVDSKEFMRVFLSSIPKQFIHHFDILIDILRWHYTSTFMDSLQMVNQTT